MKITYDPNKNTRNIEVRGTSFERVREFDFQTAAIWQDLRKPYPEPRFAALGFLDERLHFLCFAQTENGIRVISLRKANKRERAIYEKTFTDR